MLARIAKRTGLKPEDIEHMEPNEAQELQEQAEHGSHESSLRPVAFTMSVVAVLVAVTTVLNQAKASDTWNEYQAKKNRAYDTALATDLLSVVTISNKDAAQKIAKGYTGHQGKWANDLEQETKQAEAFENDVKMAEQHANRFDLSEALLEIGLVITSVTLLTRRRAYWYLGIVFSIVGIASAASVLLLK
jgi:hypothetical protein